MKEIELPKIEYEIPDEWLEVIKKVDEIGKGLRNDVVSKSFSPKSEYERMLRILSGCYCYLITEYKRWRAVKENNEVAKYVQLKNETSLKFISVAAEKEASQFVSKERYYRDYLEGWMMGCEQMIYTLKKFMDSDKQEESHS